MFKYDKDYVITWTDTAINKTLRVVFKGNKVRSVLREINSLETTRVLSVEEVK